MRYPDRLQIPLTKTVFPQYQIGGNGAKYLAYQHSPQIPADTDLRNRKYDEKHTDGASDDIEEQYGLGLSQSMENTAQCASQK